MPLSDAAEAPAALSLPCPHPPALGVGRQRAWWEVPAV